MTPRLKAVVFDLDNTLYPYAACDAAGRKAVYAYLEPLCPLTLAQLAALYAECDAETKRKNPDTAAGHNRILFYHRMCELLGLAADVHDLPLYNAYWDAYLQMMRLFPGAGALLKFLKSDGILLGLCSDLTLQIQLRKIQTLGLVGVFDKITVSEEVGADKPSPKMFQSILQKLDVSPKDAVMVGDNFKRDVLGALAAGMQAILFGETRQGILCAKNFPELSRILIGKNCPD